jgi:hypothetical protein
MARRTVLALNCGIDKETQWSWFERAEEIDENSARKAVDALG